MQSTLLSKFLSGHPKGQFTGVDQDLSLKVGFSIFNILNGSFFKKPDRGGILWTSTKRFYKVTLISDDFLPRAIGPEAGHFCKNVFKKNIFLKICLFLFIIFGVLIK